MMNDPLSQINPYSNAVAQTSSYILVTIVTIGDALYRPQTNRYSLNDNDDDENDDDDDHGRCKDHICKIHFD